MPNTLLSQHRLPAEEMKLWKNNTKKFKPKFWRRLKKYRKSLCFLFFRTISTSTVFYWTARRHCNAEERGGEVGRRLTRKKTPVTQSIYQQGFSAHLLLLKNQINLCGMQLLLVSVFTFGHKEGMFGGSSLRGWPGQWCTAGGRGSVLLLRQKEAFFMNHNLQL